VPVFAERGEGPFLFDTDGHRYIDFVGSYGPLILGHAHPRVVRGVQDTAARGLTFGAPTELESSLAAAVLRCVPGIERLRFVSSGTEAVMTALRLARGITQRELFIKFAGCYHGHADAFLSQAGSGLLTLGIASSPGVPEAYAALGMTLPFNDAAAVELAMQRWGFSVAAIVVEPIACNMGLVMPQPGFLEQLRALCSRYGALLIFDEVITGFRVGLGGAQDLFGVSADLVTFGKIIGGGMPVGAVGGKATHMQQLAPCGQVFQAGTLSGNPLGMRAGIETLACLAEPLFYSHLERTCAAFYAAVKAGIEEQKLPVMLKTCGSIFYFYFLKPGAPRVDPQNETDILAGNRLAYRRFFHAALARGLYFAPSAFEVSFCSATHHPELLHNAVAPLLDALTIGCSV
jgi:glutamate-1-semialdehyde 2,1-aminomutase